MIRVFFNSGTKGEIVVAHPSRLEEEGFCPSFAVSEYPEEHFVRLILFCICRRQEVVWDFVAAMSCIRDYEMHYER